MILVIAVAVAASLILGSRVQTGGGSPAGTASPSEGVTVGGPPTSSPNRASPVGRASAATPSGRATASPAPPTATSTPLPRGAGGLPAFNHIYLVIMENEESTGIVGNPRAPYINRLIARYGLATRYTAVAHPSEPNYLALFSGSTHGVTDDGTYNLSGRNLADQLEAHGRDWRVYEQNLPNPTSSPACFTAGSHSGGPDGSGTYARKHNPAISFTDISGDPARCAKIQSFSQLDPAAADFELIVPNLCNDMHDCSVSHGDTFLKRFLPKILDSPAMAGSVLFLTWDEGSTGAGGGGRVATVVIGPGVPAGFTSSTSYDHYSLLRTIENAWGLGCLASTCEANDLRAFWP